MYTSFICMYAEKKSLSRVLKELKKKVMLYYINYKAIKA